MYLARNESTRERALQLYDELKALAAGYPTVARVTKSIHSGELGSAHPEDLEPAVIIGLARTRAAWTLISHLIDNESTRERALQIRNELMAAAANFEERASVNLQYEVLLRIARGDSVTR